MKFAIHIPDFECLIESLFNTRKEFQEDSFPIKSCHILVSIVWIERDFE